MTNRTFSGADGVYAHKSHARWHRIILRPLYMPLAFQVPLTRRDLLEDDAASPSTPSKSEDARPHAMPKMHASIADPPSVERRSKDAPPKEDDRAAEVRAAAFAAPRSGRREQAFARVLSTRSEKKIY